MPGTGEGPIDLRGRRTDQQGGQADDAPGSKGRRYPIAAPVSCDCLEFRRRRTRYCVAVVAWNEGERLKGQLRRMQEFSGLADIVIADGCSTDGSTEPGFLSSVGVRTLLSVKERGLSTATRAALSYAIEEGYEGVVTLDGNGKDGVEAIPRFLKCLEDGYDLVQGGRFLPGGFHENTPLERFLAIRFIMSPVLWMASGYLYNDPTNAFRALSARFLRDDRVQPYRPVFVRFSLQIYLIYRAARLGFRVGQMPVTRVYPDDGTMPTKIVGWKHKWLNFSEMCRVALGQYNPKGR